MRIPVIQGVIKRRLLVNFRADPGVVQRMLPGPFRPKLHKEQAIVGVCLIRLEHVRPTGLPAIMGLSSENAAHRIAVAWTDANGTEREGVFVPRRDTSSLLNRIAGGREFPGEHHAATFEIVDEHGHIEFSMNSDDARVSISLTGDESDILPATSAFGSMPEASAFFEGGSLGYSVTKDADRLDGLLLRTLEWRVRALALKSVHSSYFADRSIFPIGSVEFDHALIMRDIRHEWHKADDLHPSHNGPATSSQLTATDVG